MTPGILFIVTAPSGAGKTTLVARLLEIEPSLRLSVSYTTRPPREGEQDGVHYHFTDRESFLAMAANGEFLESAEIYGNLYGTSQRWVAEQIEAGTDLLLEIDWQGAQQVRRGFPEAIGIFILPPSLQVLEERLAGRGKDSPEVVAQRLASAREEIGHAPEFDYVIMNQSLEVATADLVSIVRAERLRLLRRLARDPGLLEGFA